MDGFGVLEVRDGISSPLKFNGELHYTLLSVPSSEGAVKREGKFPLG